MKCKKLMCVIIGVLLSTYVISPNIVKADVKEDRIKYEEYSKKINELEEQVQECDDEISNLVVKIESNNSKLADAQVQVDNAKFKVEEKNKDIKKSEQLLSERLRQSYKSNEESTYLTIIFSSESLGDLFRNLDSVKRVISVDQDLIKNLKKEKKSLEKVEKELAEKESELSNLKDNLDKQKSSLETKKISEENLVETVKKEKKEFDEKYLATSERDLVEDLITTVCDSSNSTSEIQSALSQLQAMHDSQIESPTVLNEIEEAIGQGKLNVKLAQQREEQANSCVNKSTSELDDNETRSLISNATGTVQDVLRIAYQQLGKPYVWGATGPDTFDCSGLTSYCYRLGAGVNIGRTTYDQVKIGKLVSVNDLKPGDLIFPHAGHVQLYIGNGYVLHAPHTGDYVKVSKLGNVWKAVRVINS